MDSVGEERIKLPKISPSIARQLLSLHDRSQMPSVEEERITEMVRGRPYYERRCKRKRLMNINSLPDELLFDILIRLSAQDIHDNASYGILLHNIYKDSFMAVIKKGQIEVSRYKNYKYMSGNSCNGLISAIEPFSSGTTYIINPLTRDLFLLPRLDGFVVATRYSGIAYAAASMKYKVVLTTFPHLCSSEPCAILTVGVDKSWRILPTLHLSYRAKRELASAPLLTEGFLHWVRLRDPVLTFNVETETFIETPLPVPLVNKQRSVFLSAGRYLSLLIECGEFSWEVWEMKPESGKWRKLQLGISVEAQKLKPKPKSLTPVGWLKYLEVLVFGIGYGFEHICLVYNLGTQEINSMELPFGPAVSNALVHKSSLCLSYMKIIFLFHSSCPSR